MKQKAALFCRLVNVDVYSFDFKLDHIAKHLQLPAAPRLGPAAMQLPPEERLPPVLVINLQLPTYPVSDSGVLITLSVLHSAPDYLMPAATGTPTCRQISWLRTQTKHGVAVIYQSAHLLDH